MCPYNPRVLTALHPMLLWGLAAVTVPILIHLLLRARPKPLPWGAMRWLLMASQAASKRWKLTNLLLLLLRCLIVVLAALALARLAIPGLGGGNHLVIVIDTTASSGARRDDPGSLASAQAKLSAWLKDKGSLWRAVSVITIDPRVAIAAEKAKPDQAAAAILALTASGLPGGIDDAPDSPELALLSEADVLIVSDFQQDRAERFSARIANRTRQVSRMHMARPMRNAWIGGVHHLGDITADRGGDMVIATGGDAGSAALSIDGGPFLDVPARAENNVLSVTVPPLAAGEHRLSIRLNDSGLLLDDQLDLPITVRGPVKVVAVRDLKNDWLIAALGAQPQLLDTAIVRPADAAGIGWPNGGMVALRAQIADGARLADWIDQGGVLWTTLALAQRDPHLNKLVPAPESTTPQRGGLWRSDELDLNGSLSTAGAAELIALSTTRAQVLLRAGTAAAVAAYTIGRGRLVIESVDLSSEFGFMSRKAAPEWALRMARQLTSQAGSSWTVVSGAPAPTTATGALVREGRSVPLTPGLPILAAPGLWSWEVRGQAQTAIVLPSPSEGVINRAAPPDVSNEPATAMPARSLADLALWLLIALLVIILVEGGLAAWAGKRYAG